MTSEVRTLTASRPGERAEVEALEHKLTAARKEIGELTSMVAAGLSMEGKLKQVRSVVDVVDVVDVVVGYTNLTTSRPHPSVSLRPTSCLTTPHTS